MRHSASILRSLSLAAAVACGLTLTAPRAGNAAPDHTLGMALMAASINGADGSLARGSGVTSASRISTGSYHILFERDVAACFFTGAPANPAALVPNAGTVRLAVLALDPHGLFVQTLNVSGVAADNNFHVIVFCSQ